MIKIKLKILKNEKFVKMNDLELVDFSNRLKRYISMTFNIVCDTQVKGRIILLKNLRRPTFNSENFIYYDERKVVAYAIQQDLKQYSNLKVNVEVD